MITIKNKSSIRKMEDAGARLSAIFDDLVSLVKPDITTLSLNAWIEKELHQKGLVSRMKGYMGYKHVSCISINNEVVHGVPSERVIKNGDFLTIDVCASYKGYCADMARQFFVGDVSQQIRKFADVAERSLNAGIAQAVPGNRLSDISAAIQAEVEKEGFGVVRDFAGHGIGKYMHEDPEVLNYGQPGQGPVLCEGMALAIEPMITMGDHEVRVVEDGWTVCTKDNSLAAHVEDTIIITHNGPQNITRKQVSR